MYMTCPHAACPSFQVGLQLGIGAYILIGYAHVVVTTKKETKNVALPPELQKV